MTYQEGEQMMQLVVNQKSIDVLSLLEASRIVRAVGTAGILQDEGETFAFVTATGHVLNLDGAEVEL